MANCCAMRAISAWLIGGSRPTDLERMGQPLQMRFQAKQLAAEGPQLLGHRRAEHKAGVRNRNAGLRAGDESAVEIRLSFIHEVEASAKNEWPKDNFTARGRPASRSTRPQIRRGFDHSQRSCRSATRFKTQLHTDHLPVDRQEPLPIVYL